MPRQPTGTRADRDAACTGKEKLERSVARRIAGRNRKGRSGHLQTFKCPFCKNWHIGNKKP